MIGQTTPPTSPSAAGDQRAMNAVISGDTHDPHSVLGAHPTGGRTIIRTMRKGAKEVSVLVDTERTPMTQVHPDGIFAAEVPGSTIEEHETFIRVEIDKWIKVAKAAGIEPQ
jgi:1,4-alpha-glucan branching enzyme